MASVCPPETLHDSSTASRADSDQQAPNQPRPYPGNYLPNGGAAPSGPVPGAVPLLPNQGRVIQTGSARVLCIADVRGTRTFTGNGRETPRLTRLRKPAIAQSTRRRRSGELHHTHRRLWLLRRPFAGPYRR